MDAEQTSVDFLPALVDYQSWTGRKLLDAAERLPDGELHAGALSGGTVFDALLHILDVSYSWRRVAEGTHDDKWVWEAESIDDLASLRATWESEDHRLATFVRSLSLEDMNRVVEKPNWPGHSFRTWEVVTHIVTHQLEHGNELGWHLTSLGHSPGELGFIGYVDQRRTRD